MFADFYVQNEFVKTTAKLATNFFSFTKSHKTNFVKLAKAK